MELKHGLVVAEGHDMGGDVLSQVVEVAGFWHSCENDNSRAVWFAWKPARGKVANPVEGDARTITGRWVIAEPPDGEPRPSGLVLVSG